MTLINRINSKLRDKRMINFLEYEENNHSDKEFGILEDNIKEPKKEKDDKKEVLSHLDF